MPIELWPAMRASVHTSQPAAPSLVRNVWRSVYSTNGRTWESLSALACCFLRLLGSKWPLLVGAGHIQPRFQRPPSAIPEAI